MRSDQRRGVYFRFADNFEDGLQHGLACRKKTAMRYNPVLGVEKDHHKDPRPRP